MTEEHYKAYFQNLATQSKDLNHVEADKKKAFFVVDDPFDLSAIENALRSTVKFPAMLLDVPEFKPSGNGSANYTETVDGVFMIVKDAKPNTKAAVRDECKAIGMRILFRMHYDYKRQMIEAGKYIAFKIDDVEVSAVGPMAVSCHGYMFSFRFVCPFGFTVSGANWNDL